MPVPESTEPTAEQIKAVSSSMRLRILRLCNDREWTNRELASRLERDPATILHHVRLLVAAGLLEPLAVRQGESGAYEKPYRSTGLSWKLRFERAAEDEEVEGELAMLVAFRKELEEAGTESIAELTRFHLHLDPDRAASFIERFKNLVDQYGSMEGEHQRPGSPGYGGIFVLHRL